MNVLALATATPQVSVALAGADGELASLVVDPGSSRRERGGGSSRPRHAETLAPAIAAVSEAAAIPLERVDVVAVDVGPGLFTGLRVGVATAQALAAALQIPAVGVTSLDLLALAWWDADPPPAPDAAVAAVVDARRGQVFWALYPPGADTPSAAPVAVAPEVVAGRLAALDGTVVAVGDGARRHADVLAGSILSDPGPAGRVVVAGAEWAHPDARVLARAARRAAGHGRTVTAAELRPCYLRPADVRIGWEQRPPAAVAAPRHV